MADKVRGKMSFEYEMVDGDTATVTVEGYTKGSTAIRALEHAGSPEVLISMVKEFTEDGDMSMVALALELGAGAEKFGKEKRRT